jgi:hypothetical protein
MLTQKKRFIEKYGIAIGVLVGFGILVLVAGPATAQDLRACSKSGQETMAG